MTHKTRNSLFAGPSVFPVLISIFFVFASATAGGQDDDALIQLRSAVEQTRKQLEDERKRIEQERISQQQRLKAAEEKQQILVDQMVDLKFSVAEKKARLDRQNDELKSIRQENVLSRRQWTDIRIIATDACNTIAVSLDLMPPSESREKQMMLLDKVMASLHDGNQTYIQIAPLIDLIEYLLLESRTSAVFEDTIRDSQGYEQQVKLLRLGQILYAYKTRSGRIAVASPSSDDAAGFRWNENLPRWAKENIDRAIESSFAETEEYSLPIDVTQQIAVQQGNISNGLLARVVAGGPVMIPLAVIALLALILVIERSIFFFIQGRNTAAVAEGILSACHAGDFVKAEKLAIQNPNIVSRTMLSCLSMRLQSTADMEDAIAESVLHELPPMERFLSSIGILAGVAPLLGLLGTVTGMISTFDAITVFGSGEPKLMAGGISQALITTAAGLIIAIPILLVHSFLSSRSDNLIADTERYSATLLNLLKDQKEGTLNSDENGGKP